jgi:hypothetical protein
MEPTGALVSLMDHRISAEGRSPSKWKPIIFGTCHGSIFAIPKDEWPDFVRGHVIALAFGAAVLMIYCIVAAVVRFL